MTEYQFPSDAAPDTPGPPLKSTTPFLLGLQEGDDPSIEAPKWLIPWLCLSTAFAAILTFFAVLIIPMTRLMFADNPTATMSKIMFYLFLIGVPALLLWLTFLLWREYSQERNYSKAFKLSLPSVAVGVGVTIFLCAHSGRA